MIKDELISLLRNGLQNSDIKPVIVAALHQIQMASDIVIQSSEDPMSRLEVLDLYRFRYNRLIRDHLPVIRGFKESIRSLALSPCDFVWLIIVEFPANPKTLLDVWFDRDKFPVACLVGRTLTINVIRQGRSQ